MRRVRTFQTRLLPHGPWDVARQVLLFFLAYNGYRLVRGLADEPGVTAAAFQHARNLIGVERSLHVFVEPSVQAWSTSRGWVIDFASWMYVNSQFVVTTSAMPIATMNMLRTK